VVERLLRLRVVADPAVMVEAAVLAVTPVGAPETASVSGAAKVPWTEPQETERGVDCPAIRLTLDGEAANVQLADTGTTAVNDVVWVTPPPVALTVMG
jgi:hypothetical protein